MQRQFKRPASAFVTLALVLVLGVSVLGQFESSGNTGSQDQSNTVFTSADAIRSAQTVLRDRGFYTGPINGVMTPATRNALRQFQRDRNLPETGDLDSRTAQALGIASDTGSAADLVEIINPRAERIGRDSVRIDLTARTRLTGWRIITDNFVTGNTLHVYVRGVPPRYASGQRIDEQRITETINNANNVSRVVFHGAQRDITVDLFGGGGPGGGGNPAPAAPAVAASAFPVR